FTTKGVGKGTGLGLATSYGIVSQAGGTITIDSTLGVGTIVRVLLPITADAVLPPRHRKPSVTPTGHETVLVVDDDAAVRGVTATALRRQGYRVLEADSGTAALQQSRAESGRIHALVTDVAMPHMSGPALAAQLVRERPEMRVLYVSGYADDGIAHHGILDDGVVLLQKPYDIRELAQRVRDLLELKGSDAT
ncbi:MAG: response regulator, partial [Gemmatimonas sp.]